MPICERTPGTNTLLEEGTDLEGLKEWLQGIGWKKMQEFWVTKEIHSSLENFKA
jgi:hypothetical protein